MAELEKTIAIGALEKYNIELRDYFATHAPVGPVDWRDPAGMKEAVARAYRWADAMMAERGRKTPA